MMLASGLLIYLQPRVNLDLDLLISKIDRFMLLPRGPGPLMPIYVRIGSQLVW